MGMITGIVRGDHVELDGPTPFPDGTRVRIQPAEETSENDEQYEWPTTPEGIEAMIRELQAIEPAVLTPEEEAAIAARRKAMKERDIELMRQRMGLDP
ncbi:MAG TPA: hypothetical protein VKD90_14575 [Gemmataceae bacterium]|nr:hypothetical protein [Gemmataceae bacterium]